MSSNVTEGLRKRMADLDAQAEDVRVFADNHAFLHYSGGFVDWVEKTAQEIQSSTPEASSAGAFEDAANALEDLRFPSGARFPALLASLRSALEKAIDWHERQALEEENEKKQKEIERLKEIEREKQKEIERLQAGNLSIKELRRLRRACEEHGLDVVQVLDDFCISFATAIDVNSPTADRIEVKLPLRRQE